MHGNTCAAGTTSQSTLPLHDLNDARAFQRSARTTVATPEDGQHAPAAKKPLARIGRAILTWLDKEDDRVALI